MEWLPIESIRTPSPVLVFYKNSLGNGRIIKARYIKRFSEESNSDFGDSEDGVDEYDEENDRYTYRQGWWECIDNWGDFSFIAVSEGEPTHWMPLPEPPK